MHKRTKIQEKINKEEIKDVKQNVIINFTVKLDSFSFEIIKANTIIKKGFNNSTGCNLKK